MKKYEIEITEVLQRTVTVEAENLAEAYDKIFRMYRKEEIVLDCSDYIDTNIKAL